MYKHQEKTLSKALTALTALSIFALLFILMWWAVYGEMAGYEASQKKEYRKAVVLWTPLAWGGSGYAQFALAHSYETGRGVDANHDVAVKWYTKAAEKGEAGAQFNLGEKYRKGFGIPKDSAKAIYWLTKAANLKVASAENNLGKMYSDGDGLPQDVMIASFWFYSAIANGDVTAWDNLLRVEQSMTSEQIEQAKIMFLQNDYCQ